MTELLDIKGNEKWIFEKINDEDFSFHISRTKDAGIELIQYYSSLHFAKEECRKEFPD